MSDYLAAFAAITSEHRLRYRDHLGKPFRDGDSDIATDGRGIVIVPSALSGATEFGDPNKKPPWRGILRLSPGAPTKIPRKRLDSWLRCEPKTFSLCDNCDTEDGQHHCCDCDGSGFAMRGVVCGSCRGEGNFKCSNHKPMTLIDWEHGPMGRVGGVLINRYMAWTVLQHLSGKATVFTADPKALDYVEFAGDNWRFLLMPINERMQPDEHKDAPVLTPTREADGKL